MVDLDPLAQTFTEIWALKLRVPGYFTADMEEAPLQYYWNRQIQSVGDMAAGGAYQSILKNIRWESTSDNSQFILQLKEIMESIGSMKLSIRFYVDLYSMVPNRNFTLGRIIGTIGIQGPDSPLVSPWARIMRPTVSAENKYHDAMFVVERTKKRILIELGNSLPLDKIGFPFKLKNVSNLFVAFSKNKLLHFNCSDSFVWIGKIPIEDHAWFEDYAGSIWFNLDERQAIQLQSTPLMLVEVSCPLFFT